MRCALLLILLLPALPLVLAPSPALACSCAMVSVQEYADRASDPAGDIASGGGEHPA